MPRHDDDDDIPRRRRPRDDDEDDDRPSRRRRRDEDEEDDRPRARKARRDEDDYDDRPRKKKKARPPVRETHVVGVVALVIGILALAVSIFMPCIASYSFIVSGIGIVVGLIALVMAQQSDGRLGSGMPIGGLSMSAAAVLIAVGWLVLGKQVEKRFENELKEVEAEMAKEEAERKAELEKAAKEVQAVDPEAVIRVSAAQFAKAFVDDEDRANQMYKDKVIEITGTVDETYTDDDDDSYSVHLKTGPGVDGIVDCQFAMTADNRAKLRQLREGQAVRIRGKCEGGTVLTGCMLLE